jgi:hypothetical protein
MSPQDPFLNQFYAHVIIRAAGVDCDSEIFLVSQEIIFFDDL